jgi:predicted transcriptional regulator
MINKDIEQADFAFDNMMEAGVKIAQIMFAKLYSEDQEKAAVFVEKLQSELPKVALQIHSKGIDLVILDSNNKAVGGPLISYVKKEPVAQQLN